MRFCLPKYRTVREMKQILTGAVLIIDKSKSRKLLNPKVKHSLDGNIIEPIFSEEKEDMRRYDEIMI